MKEQEILEKIEELIHNFSWWNDKDYQTLLELNSDDIINETENSYNVTYLLEKIYDYSRIVDYIENSELDELIKLTNEKTIYKLENAIRIALWCKKYTNKIEESGTITKHPVCKYNDSKDYMYLTEDTFYQILEEYTKISTGEEQDKIYDILDSIDSVSSYYYENYFSNTIKPEIDLALEYANEEEILSFLSNYVFEKEIRENGSYELVSELKSRLMMYLNNNYYNHTEEVNLIYEDLEEVYMQNKFYLNNYKILSKKICKM